MRLRATLVALALVAAARAGEPEPFMKLHRLILPDTSESCEKWKAIPWLTDLWEARKQASEKGAPIFLWEMDGHPLGCT